MATKPKKQRKYCAVYSCMKTDREPDLNFFRFPRDANRRRTWILAIGREDLLSKCDTMNHTSYHACSLHFEESAIKIVKQLKEDAIPTLSLPDLSEDNKKATKSIETQTEISLISPEKTEASDLLSEEETSNKKRRKTNDKLTSNLKRKRKARID
ncbi:hypothetical protein JYU34_013335 [Plutella xylostella]|uniref:THAP-type domain-containing protein n=1 Tax=Plutella xylostella TaxID=51655 RepID=A0ABQ7Q9K4_PLUXY|nr:hypothetical protein JYU34_013335 [Plutella xylostella]